MRPLIFKDESPESRYQARFWTTPEKWKRFADLVRRNEMTITGVMGQFLDWYLATQSCEVTDEKEKQK